MRRRDFIQRTASLGVAWPLAARAQQATRPVIGVLAVRTPEFDAPLVEAFNRGMNETGYFEGKNIVIEYRWAAGHFDRLPALADELVQKQVALIVTFGGTASARAAKTATSSIPIVFSIGDDPVKLGLVTNLSRPGGNITGATNFYGELAAKQLGLLRRLVPSAAVSRPGSTKFLTHRRRQNQSSKNSSFSELAPKARSTPHLLISSNNMPARCCSVPIHSSSPG